MIVVAWNPFASRRWSKLLTFEKLNTALLSARPQWRLRLSLGTWDGNTVRMSVGRQAKRPLLFLFLGVNLGLLGIHLCHQFLDPINRKLICNR